MPKDTPVLYSPIYQEILNDVKNNPNVDQGTKNWLVVAIKVNAGDPKSLVFQYIRTETQQALADQGKPISDSRFTEGSNKLGESIVNKILADGALSSAGGDQGLVITDARAVVRDFGGELSDWAGVTPYGLGDYYLGVDTRSFTPAGKEKPPSWYFDVFNKAGNKAIDAGSESGSGTGIPAQIYPELKKYFDGFVDWQTKADECVWRPIRDAVWQFYTGGLNWRQPSDPLIRDLDGDGIELAIASNSVLFDHNADNIRTGTQWVKPDDGILVRDLNGNGVIDSGRELFGDQTELPPGFGNVLGSGGSGSGTGTLGTGLGGPQLATNGWQALAALDSNRNGIINASDAALTELEVLRDLNQGAVRYPNSSRDGTALTKNLGSSTSTKPAETKTCKRRQSAFKSIAAYACV